MALTVPNLSNNIAKALLFDAILVAGLVGIKNPFYATLEMVTHVFTGAFTAYTLRDIARDYNHPWIGGLIAGAIKYTTKDGNPFIGAYNNGAYEYAKDNAAKFAKESTSTRENLAVIIIETADEAMGNLYKTYQNNGTASEYLLAGVNGALFGGIIIGGSLVGLGATFFDPLKNAVEHLPSIVINAIGFLALTDCGYKVGSQLGNAAMEYYNNYNTNHSEALVNNISNTTDHSEL